MQFASMGAAIQNGLMARARKRLFLFDSTVQPSDALTDPVSWVKKMTEARSVAYNISDNKLQATACSGFLSQNFYPAHTARHYPFYRSVNSFAQFSASDSLSQREHALKFGVMSYLPNVSSSTFAAALSGPLSLSNADGFDTYSPKFFPANFMQTMLVPQSQISKLGVMKTVADATATYSSAGGGSNYSYSYSYQLAQATYRTELDSYQQSSVDYVRSTQGAAVNIVASAPYAGLVFGYSVQRYFYNPLQGNTSDSYTYSWPGGNNNVPLQHPALFAFTATGQPDSAAFNIEWAACPVWNGEKIICELMKAGTDFVNNVQQQTNIQPDITLNSMPSPAISLVISV